MPLGQDTCDSIRRKNFISATEFSNLNPGLDCNKLFPQLQRSDGGEWPRIGTEVRAFATDRCGPEIIAILCDNSWLKLPTDEYNDGRGEGEADEEKDDGGSKLDSR